MTTPQDPGGAEGDVVQAWRDGVELGNEFTTVRLRLVETQTGTRLEVFSPRVERRIRLDPLALESLTWQTAETFSRFLETPLGPDL